MRVSISVVIFRESWSYNFTYLNLGGGMGLRGTLTLSAEPIISVLPYDDRQLE
jgi:hypothetical protein